MAFQPNRTYFYDADTGEEVGAYQGAGLVGIGPVWNGKRYMDAALESHVHTMSGRPVQFKAEDFRQRIAVKVFYPEGRPDMGPDSRMIRGPKFEWFALVARSRGWQDALDYYASLPGFPPVARDRRGKRREPTDAEERAQSEFLRAHRLPEAEIGIARQMWKLLKG